MKSLKNIIGSIVLVLMICSLNGCAWNTKKIEIDDMQAIAELATTKCYFHNVAKSDEPTDKVWFEFWRKKNIRFWIEYDGTVDIGVDASKINVEVNEDKVTITMPPAEVFDVSVEESSLTDESFYYDSNSEKPDENDEKEAFKVAQENMKKTAEQNGTLLNNARDNAKKLLENYIRAIEKETGKKYMIEWKDLDKKD